MKRLRGFLILVYIIVTLLVMIIHPAMHKPVALENTDFKLNNQILNPKQRFISDFEVKIKFYRRKPLAAANKEQEIFIPEEDNDRQLTMNFEEDANFREASFEFSDGTHSSEQTIELDTRANDETYREQNIDYQSQNVGTRDIDVNIGSGDVPTSRDVEIGLEDGDIPQTELVLEDKDEVGSKAFKASREEVVAWNVWRSNLQNTIMMESAIEAPVGTLISFAFDVSASGRITNLKYRCSNKKYEAAGRADMVTILRHISGTEVLKFPANTKRTNVKFKGAFMLDYSTSFSKPSDYSDYERVRY